MAFQLTSARERSFTGEPVGSFDFLPSLPVYAIQ